MSVWYSGKVFSFVTSLFSRSLYLLGIYDNMSVRQRRLKRQLGRLSKTAGVFPKTQLARKGACVQLPLVRRSTNAASHNSVSDIYLISTPGTMSPYMNFPAYNAFQREQAQSAEASIDPCHFSYKRIQTSPVKFQRISSFVFWVDLVIRSCVLNVDHWSSL